MKTFNGITDLKLFSYVTCPTCFLCLPYQNLTVISEDLNTYTPIFFEITLSWSLSEIKMKQKIQLIIDQSNIDNDLILISKRLES